MSMIHPELYNNNNSATRNSAIKCLNEYAPKLKWNLNGETIIDLGCGDGSVTCILKKYVPYNYTKFVACDISEKMIQFAKENYSDEDIMFKTLDIAGDIPNDMRCGYSHVFSFLMLQWVQDQKKAYKNIYDLMSAGGECLLVILGYNHIGYLYDIIYHDTNMKWGSTWLKDRNKFMTLKYLNSPDPVKYITEMMNNIGFHKVNVQHKKMTYMFPNIVELKNFMKAVDPYEMPNDVFEEFFHDFVALGKEMNLFDKNLDNLCDLSNEVKYDYEEFIVHASK